MEDRTQESKEYEISKLLKEYEETAIKREIKSRKFMVTGFGLLFLTIIICMIFTSNAMRSMENNLSYLSNEVSGIKGYIDSQFYQWDENLKKQNNILEDYGYEVKNIDPAKNRVTLSFRAVPKVYTDGTRVNFMVTSEGFEPVTLEGKLSGSQLFTCQGEFPISNDMKIYVNIIEKGETKNQLMETLYDIKGKYELHTSIGFSGTTSPTKGDSFSIKGDIEVSVFVPSEQDGSSICWPVKGVMQYYVKGKLCGEVEMDISSQEPSDMTGERFYRTAINETFKGKSEDFNIIATITDNWGTEYTSEWRMY